MPDNLNLNWIRTFEAVARLSGFTAAAGELGLTQTAVSQHIKALETKLGHDLFIRRAKSIQLTEIGKAYLPSVRHSLESLALSTNGLFGPNLKSTIVVRASMAAIIWISSRLGEFHRQHPDIGIKFVTAIWADTRDTQSVDIDILLAPNGHISDGLEKLAEEQLVPVFGMENSSEVRSVYDLAMYNPIHILGFDDHWSRYMKSFGLTHDVKSTRLMVDTSVAACEMVASGLGCAVVLKRFADDAISKGQSIEIVGDPVPLYQSHFLLQRNPATENGPSVAVFKEWLKFQFSS